MLGSLTRHAVQLGLQSGKAQQVVADFFGLSVRTVRRIAREEAIMGADDSDLMRKRERGRRYLKRQDLFEIGQNAQLFPSEVVHRRPDRWHEVVDLLHDLLQLHGADAIAYRAIQNGFEARFVTAAALIDDPSRATHQGSFRERLQTYSHPHVLVINELGYLSYGVDAANVLFHVVNERHQRKRPILLTTNKALVDWGNVLHEPDLAEAIVDRILERGRLIQLDGPSIRTKHLGVDPLGQPVLQEDTISGNHRPDFMEPATDGARMGVAIVDNQPGCAIRFCQQGYGKYAIDNVMINQLEL